MRLLGLTLLLGFAAACSDRRAAAAPRPGAALVTTSTGNVSRTQGDSSAYPVIRALYLNRFAAQGPKTMRRLLAIADSTEINGFVIDMKDEFGLNYKSKRAELARNAGSHGMVGTLKALLDSLRAHEVYSIARIVVFKDPVAASLNPSWTIKSPDSSDWRDEKGNVWVNPYNKEVWNYNISVAEELAKLGFDEIQFDYIRFPEPYRRLAKQVFPGNEGLSKPDVLAAFLKDAKKRLDTLGVLTTADVFGLVTTVRGPLEVGQWWEKISPHVDVVLPMVYPSHYPRGAFGIDRPNAEPYTVLKTALDTARTRDEKLGISKAEHVRPWIQAFSLGQPPYGPEQILAQKQAIYDAGFNGWVMWSPGSKYSAFIPALEPKSALPP